MKKSVIAIDGPAGAGKSTIAKMAAKKLNYIYIDTGAMYRGVAWLVLQKYQVPVNTAQVLSVIEDINIRLAYDDNGNMLIFVNEQDVSTAIRTPEVTALVSQVAAISEVRQKMVELQRKMAQDGSVLMDGRDIGTCVLPNADLKIYLTASADERANRRAKEMREKGYDVDVEEIKKELEANQNLDYQYIILDVPLLFESKLEKLGIRHKLIKPYTPRHNGKVERSHRKDQERFYYKKVFYSFEDLVNRAKYWIKEYNNFPMRPLKWLSPREKYLGYINS